MKSTVIPKQKPISKEKVKEVLDIMDVAHAFSGAINERPRQPLILCPFHQLTSTWVPAGSIVIPTPFTVSSCPDRR